MNNYEHTRESQYPGCANSIAARDEVDPRLQVLSNAYYTNPYYTNSLTYEQTPGLTETQFSYPCYNQLSNYTPHVDLKPMKQNLTDVLYSNEMKPEWEESHKLAFKCKIYLCELFQYEQEYSSEFLQRHLDLTNEIIVALTNRVAKIQAKLRSLLEQPFMFNKSSPAASLYEIKETINHWLPYASSQISHACASNELKSEIKPEDSKNCAYEIKEKELQICHSTINEMKSYDEENVDFSTVAPKIINLINKPSEYIQYGMEIFDQIEPNIVFMGSINFVYKCFWTDLFLNYFDGNLLEQRENYSNYWLDIHVEKIQIKFPGKKSEPEIQDMLTNEKFDLNFLLLCLELFLDKYFVFLLNLSEKIYDEVKFLFFYSETWKNFLNTTLNISQKYSLEFNQLFNMKDGETSPILSKSLIYWKYAFFQHNELVPEAVWKLIEAEENGESKTTSSIPDSVVISYKVLGLIEKSKLVDIAQSPQPMDCFEFIDWHMEKFKGKHRKRNQIEYKSEAILKPSKSACRKPRGRHIKTECSEPSNSESKKKNNYCRKYGQCNRATQKKMQEKLSMESNRNNELNEIFIKYQEEIEKINSTLKDSKSTIVSENSIADYSSFLTNIHETEKDLSTKFEQLKSSTNDSSDSSDDDFILLPEPKNFSKNPIRLEFEPPSLEWRQEKCRELKLSPVEPATEFGPPNVIPWNMAPKRIQKIKGDGNCLFRALVYFLTGHDSDILHVRMRYLICKYMEDHRDDPAILSWVQKYANNVMEYLEAGMRIPGKWGTEVEIQVFARMLNCIVAVWNPGYFANEDQIRWNRYNFYAMEYQPTLFLLFEKSHFNICLM